MSLQRLFLKDFAIISALDMEFQPGFTALTGETGAGKSILIDALQLVLGGRADASAVRDGQQKADISAEFLGNHNTNKWMLESDFDVSDSVVLLRRSIDLHGRSRAWINGTPATATQLREIGGLLIDIHGQHAWQNLIQPDMARKLLDGYGGIDPRETEDAWRIWRQTKLQLAQAQASAEHHAQQYELLTRQLTELTRLAPQTREWERLQEEHMRLANAQTLIDAAQTAAMHLTENDDNAINLLVRASQALTQRAHMEPVFETLVQSLSQALVLTQEATRDVQSYLRHTEVDPSRLAVVELRMGQWLSLARRHGCSANDLSALVHQWQEQLRQLSDSADPERLLLAEADAQRAYTRSAQAISIARVKAARRLSDEVTTLMQRLGMAGGCFSVVCVPQEQPQASGLERIEFEVAGHAGVSPKPLAKVASGGELSRIALAVAVVTSQLGSCDTVIFDEVDSGIGGSVAHTVGQLMRELGTARQVLAVTHLAQVAACANSHYFVSKQATEAGVHCTVATLNDAERVAEIARMMGGQPDSVNSLAHASEMLNS